jgi:hypothetical protein
MQACQPIIDLVQGIAYPLAYISIATGICLIIIGQKNEGFRLVKWAGIGYILMQWVPGLMKMMHEIGKGLK